MFWTVGETKYVFEVIKLGFRLSARHFIDDEESNSISRTFDNENELVAAR